MRNTENDGNSDVFTSDMVVTDITVHAICEGIRVPTGESVEDDTQEEVDSENSSQDIIGETESHEVKDKTFQSDANNEGKTEEGMEELNLELDVEDEQSQTMTDQEAADSIQENGSEVTDVKDIT